MALFERLVSAILAIWLAATLAFFALRILPGDAISTQLAESGASPAVVSQRREELGLDDPVLIQYGRFVAGLTQADLGYSLLDGLPVTQLILQQFLPTCQLALAAFVVAVGLGLLLGITGGTRTGWGVSAAARTLVGLALSVPIYWSGTLVIFVSTKLLMPDTLEQLDFLALPALLLGLHSSGAIARVVMANLQETLNADFVRTARAKGLRERDIIRRHVLRAALPPVITAVAVQAGFLLGGTVITESLFVRPGIGHLLLNRTITQDYPVVQGIVVVAAIAYTIVNALADILHRWVNPALAQDHT